ncbi:MAG TPA: sigma-70 family RNA polymerase sigma factor [Anaerohalosphaeraceae bacterium]|nr:sigma-70 family RNA polymerase sigma factor [Anaerohalosphaeraceae bacterium]
MLILWSKQKIGVMALTDKTLFIELYSREQKKIFLYVLNMVHHWSDAEDIMQQTAAEMWRMFDHFEAGTNFASWGIAIARYRILDYRKKQQSKGLFLSLDVYEKITQIMSENERHYEQRKNALQGCLNKLKDADRRKLSMHYDAGLHYNQIAEQLNISKTGIYKIMARIHANLQKCIRQTLLVWETNA